MRVVVAPDSFKDCLSAIQVAEAIAAGLATANPQTQIEIVPMADGGQGTLEALLRATNGVRRSVQVLGPLGEPRTAAFGLIDNGMTAILEMAAASGLELVPPPKRDPTTTTTYGTGQLMSAALDAGVDRIIVGIGGSATNDAGAGMAEALGYKFLDRDGRQVPRGGGFLHRVHSIDSSRAHPRLGKVRIDVACDVTNPLTGPEGASAIYGPQKGASADAVHRLDSNLAHFASVIHRDRKLDVDAIPGAGAAGGLGAGLIAFAGANLRRGVELVIDAVHLRDKLSGAHLCITGEGSIDSQSAFGKTAFGVATTCQQYAVPCVAIAGAVQGDLAPLFQAGLTAAFSINPKPASLQESIQNAQVNITRVAEQILRLFLADRTPDNR